MNMERSSAGTTAHGQSSGGADHKGHKRTLAPTGPNVCEQSANTASTTTKGPRSMGHQGTTTEPLHEQGKSQDKPHL